MADFEMYDRLTSMVADYTTTTLSVSPQQILVEEMEKNQDVHLFDDGSERVISRSNACIFMVSLAWLTGISSSDAGTIMDLFSDPIKANAYSRSFYWAHPMDGHTYVAKFRSALTRNWRAGKSSAGKHEIAQIKLKIIGRQ
jgi:hypothetical protein